MVESELWFGVALSELLVAGDRGRRRLSAGVSGVERPVDDYRKQKVSFDVRTRLRKLENGNEPV